MPESTELSDVTRRRLAGSRESDPTCSLPAVRQARRILENHAHFRGRAHWVQVQQLRETLILTGRVPSFYLKQLAQEALSQLDGIEQIENRIDVTCPCGLSSSPCDSEPQDGPAPSQRQILSI